jgi:hypothetical protein
MKIPGMRVAKLPDNSEMQASVGKEFQVYWSGVFGIYKQPKQTIKTNTEELLDKFEELFGGGISENDLVYGHPFGVIETDPSQQQVINAMQDNDQLIIQ